MPPPTLPEVQKDAFDRILSEAVESKSTPALFFGVTNAEGPIYMRTMGTKLVDDPTSEPIDEDTVFWLCSQTKLITSIAALQLIEQGKITLDTPVETRAAQLQRRPPRRKITFGQLLNHSSGLDYFVDGTTPMTGPARIMPVAYSHHYKDGEGVSKFFEIVKGSFPGVPLRFEPGNGFAYGFSTDCAGFIVERLSGKSLEQYFQDHIFAPLGITSASFYLTPPLKSRLLPLSYRNKSGGVEPWKGPHVVNQDLAAHVAGRVHLGGVGLHMSQKDYLTILRHLLQIKGGTVTNRILSRASVDSMFAPTLPPVGAAIFNEFIGLMMGPTLGLPAGDAQFGRGLFVTTEDVPGKRRKGSGAWAGWAATSFFLDPTTGVAAVFATQIAPTGDETHEQLYALLERELYAGL
ncbi:hypothetical protein MVEN_02123700 [Mycena venus]|uniref:Beta-lactamase-related domain-containing protein n=1 Tax=Mycena venus TaxID=2733690 RepID=A0A8H6XAD9_9AGAR|nr:hypothetical protein MVEN_02123700 [Mycena venus]